MDIVFPNLNIECVAYLHLILKDPVWKILPNEICGFPHFPRQISAQHLNLVQGHFL